MQDNPLRLSRQQFLVTAGLGGVAVGIAACSGYGRQSSTADANTTAGQPVPSGGAATPLAATTDVPVGSGVIVDDIVVTQPSAGMFEAFSAVCTHAGCTLAEVSDGTINCLCHGSKFNLDGTVANGPASRPLDPKTIAIDGDVIVTG